VSAEILTVTNINDSGTGSLRGTIELANNGDSIIFDKSLAGKTIVLQSDIIKKDNYISISISGKNTSVIISGGKINFQNYFSGKVDNMTFINSGISNCSLISDCIFRNCNCAIYYYYNYSSIHHSVPITNCIFENNIGYSYDGGVIYCSSSEDFTITNCIFKNNTLGVISDIGNSTITDCTFENNSGNVIAVSIPYITNCTFMNNSGSSVNGVEGSITNCIFKNNPSNNRMVIGDFSITNCTFEDSNGGAISGGGNITNCIFKNNTTAIGNGGAISGADSISNCTFENNTVNTATGNGGAVYEVNNITNCTFENNTANNGGAIYISSKASVTNCTFSDNNAFNIGGAVCGSGANLKGNLFVNNKIWYINPFNHVLTAELGDVYFCKSLGYNVYTSNDYIFSQSTDYKYTGTQSLLISLGDYGGNTPTMPINTSIPNWETTVRRVPVSSNRTTDQRGLSLPKTGLICAGSVEMQPGENFTSINEIKKESVNVYPNPTSDIIHFALDENSEVQIFDTLGKLVKEQAGNIGSNEINISDLPKGVYFLNVNRKQTKIIKK